MGMVRFRESVLRNIHKKEYTLNLTSLFLSKEYKTQMMMRIITKNITLIIVLFTGLSSFTPTTATLNKWNHIDTKKVNYRIDRDVMYVGADDGRFSKLKLRVTGGDLNMHRMIVHYVNGAPDEIQLRHTFNKRSKSRVIDLKGNKRFIKKIVFIYDTQNNENRKARIAVFGKQ